MTALAIMQPYFFPYAGYFRLFAAADLFVIYDCVQFPRRGWVHRNRLPDENGAPAWLNLPLEKAPRATAIKDLRFPNDAARRLTLQMQRFPVLLGDHPMVRNLTDFAGLSPVDYLERGLIAVCTALGLSCETRRSSSLKIPPEVRGQDRILAIAEALGADRYINAPGGGALYESQTFSARGIELQILEPYSGASWSMLHRLLSEPAQQLAGEIRQQT